MKEKSKSYFPSSNEIDNYDVEDRALYERLNKLKTKPQVPSVPTTEHELNERLNKLKGFQNEPVSFGKFLDFYMNFFEIFL